MCDLAIGTRGSNLRMATPMDQSPPPAHPAAGVPSSSAAHIAYNAPPHQQQAAMSVPPPSSFPSSSTQLTFQQAHQFHLQQQQHQQQQLQAFWADRILEIEQTTDFKNHSLPLARIKKIMKADEEVRMISAETPIVFAKACETFILELTLRSWMNTEENKRRTLQKNDIAAAITRTDIFDFLVDIVPRDELKEEGLGFPRPGPAALPMVGVPSDSLPYYHVPPPTTFMGKSMERAADIYLPHLGAYMWQMQQGQPHQQHQAQQQQQTMPE